MPMANKLCSVVTYNKEHHPITSYDSSITCSCEYVIEYVIYLLALDQWPPNKKKWCFTMREFHP